MLAFAGRFVEIGKRDVYGHTRVDLYPFRRNLAFHYADLTLMSISDPEGIGALFRKVYELQAIVRPGNSGGPFVLASGKVGGVVFAASTTDGSVGYALAAADVGGDLARARGRTAPVSTGHCVG